MFYSNFCDHQLIICTGDASFEEARIGEGMEEDMRVEEDIYPDAARVLWTDETLHERWQREFGDEGGQDGRFAPFDSEVDWRVAEWALKSGVSHRQLDRLLAIPGVRVLLLVPPILTLLILTSWWTK